VVLKLARNDALCHVAQVSATESPPRKAAEYVTDLLGRGRYTFTTAQAKTQLGLSEMAAQAALRRLKRKGVLADPARGFHVIVPPEYRHLGCLPASEFVPELMAFLRAPYYAGLLTAAEIHGAAHHKPQVFQVVTDRNRRALGAGRVRIELIAKAGVEATPTVETVTDRGYLRVSTPEATAFDLLIYPRHAGGLDNAATVLAELADKLDPTRLVQTAARAPMTAVQRTGFLLELVGQPKLAEPLAQIVASGAPAFAPLRPGRPMQGARRDRRWRLAVNVEVEPEV